MINEVDLRSSIIINSILSRGSSNEGRAPASLEDTPQLHFSAQVALLSPVLPWWATLPSSDTESSITLTHTTHNTMYWIKSNHSDRLTDGLQELVELLFATKNVHSLLFCNNKRCFNLSRFDSCQLNVIQLKSKLELCSKLNVDNEEKVITERGNGESEPRCK